MAKFPIENVSSETKDLIGSRHIQLHQDVRDYSVTLSVKVKEQDLGNLSTFLDDLTKIII